MRRFSRIWRRTRRLSYIIPEGVEKEPVYRQEEPGLERFLLSSIYLVSFVGCVPMIKLPLYFRS